MTRKILFLMSDTGGGHRAAANAITAALDAQHHSEFAVELVDMWRDYTPWPANTMPTTYGKWVNAHPASYEAQYWLNDRLMHNPFVSRFYEQSMWPRMQHLYRDHPSDVVVCVHSVFVRPALHARERLGLTMPFVTVVTDYALPTVLWYDARASKTLVPVQPALERGRALGLPEERLVLTGPITHPKFNIAISKAQAREQLAWDGLGWDAHATTVLLVGGGDGMGPILETAKAIDALPSTNTNLVVVAGKNTALKTALETHTFNKPTRVYGFTDNMPVFMRAADVLISKAGPATISEAALLGTPIIMNGAIRYQESPNAEYVVAQGAGLYAATPERVAQALLEVLQTPGRLTQMQHAVQRLAVPDATARIAEEIWNVL